MMKITFSPMRSDTTLELVKRGDGLSVNGQDFDFSQLAEGDSLPALDIGSEWFAGPVERRDGVLHVHLILPHGATAPHETRFPAEIDCGTDGPIPVPPHGIAAEIDEEQEPPI